MNIQEWNKECWVAVYAQLLRCLRVARHMALGIPVTCPCARLGLCSARVQCLLTDITRNAHYRIPRATVVCLRSLRLPPPLPRCFHRCHH
jgi:hypothetical protein